MSGVIQTDAPERRKTRTFTSGFTPEQAQKYFETRLADRGGIRKQGSSYMALCPFHDDHTRSMSINFEKGVWHCHTEAVGGGMMDFEKKLFGSSDVEAVAAINAIIGIAQGSMFSGKPEATYDYRDEQHKLIFQVLRYRDPVTQKKRISCRRPVGTNGWEYTVEGSRRLLYRLPEVIRATEVLVVEGEKCVEAVRAAYNEFMGETDACEQRGFAVTTSPFGAGKWHDEFAPYFAGKKVIVIPDNDDKGRAHMELVCASVNRYAVGVRWLDLPVANAKDDVADVLKQHDWSYLQGLLAGAQPWRRAAQTGIFQSARMFMRHKPAQPSWLVEGVIEDGTSGFIIALPKAGKSVATVGLAAALACGATWLDFTVTRPVRVALVSREDSPGLTSRRMNRVIRGLKHDPEEQIFEDNLFVNSREQSAALSLDDDQQFSELVTTLREKRIEFCILDVLNVLHDADENDNTEMRRVLNRVQQIRTEVGCQICIVHHAVKEMDDNRTLSQLARGASAISGFAEFIIGLRMIDEPTQTRHMRFETKSAEPAPAFYWKIHDVPLTNALVLERTDYQDERRQSPRERAARLVKENR